MWVRSLGRKDPLEEEMATHSSIPAGKSHGQRSLMDYSPCLKESDMTEHTHTHTHFSPLYVFLLYFPLCDNLHKPFINLEKSPFVNYISYKYFSKLIIVGVFFCFFSLVKLLLQSFCLICDF